MKDSIFKITMLKYQNFGSEELVLAGIALFGVDSEFGKNRTFTKNKCKHYRLFLI